MARARSRSNYSDQRGPSEDGVSIEILHQQLTDAITKIETGEQWKAWLDFACRLHRYSFNNLILIWAQRPDATAVASYTTWKALNRQVRRGEKALRVMAPILRRAPVLDEAGRPALGPDGRPKQRQQITGFRPAPVFDVAQTEGPPLPEAPQPVLLAGQTPDGVWDALVGEVSQRGYRLLRGPVDRLGGANGVTKVSEREVWVRDDVDDAQAAKTLTHELAHIMLHAEADQPTPCAGIREVEAESVAHLVMAAHGVDTAGYSFPYVATWAHPLAAVEHVPMADIVSRTGTRVMQAATEILTAAVPASVTDPSTAALAARVTLAAERSDELHDRAAASLLPPVERATLLGVLADSQEFFRRQIGSSWVPNYLRERRLDAAIGSEGLGYAPRSWTALTDHLRSLGYTDDHIEAAGIGTRARNGHLIDRFRDRLTIPLRDRDGSLVGFTARSGPQVGKGDAPKYLNSPTTAIFRKSEVMYGLTAHATSVNVGRLPVVCEGPLDAIAVDLVAAERGLSWVGLASIGTSFTEQNAEELRAVAGGRPIYLAFDGDDAGRNATEAAWRRLTNHSPYDVRVAELPDGTDPASLLPTEQDTLAQVLQGARPAATVIAARQIDAARLDGNAAREVAAFRSLSQLTNRMPTEQRPPYLLELARRLRIDPSDAAVIAVEQDPAILMERAASRAHQLDLALREDPGPGRVDAQQPSDRQDHEMVRTISR
ncbi:MAG TPA: toprim domain-containing protein [Propionibacteriaceae bacterium]|nr:toprim domain-containing protein [Propionibacteriaceae bacterium]